MMGNVKTEYQELARAVVSQSRNVVISQCSRGGFTVAQQLEVNEGNKVMAVFLKGAVHVDSVEGLFNLRDALNVAIENVTNKKD